MRSMIRTGVLSLLLAAAGAGCGGNAKPDVCSRGVDTRAWRGTVDQRQSESDVIVRCSSLSGKTSEEVRKLLGNPTEKEPAIWLYVTGPVRRWHIDDEFLQVTFADGRVETAQLVEG